MEPGFKFQSRSSTSRGVITTVYRGTSGQVVVTRLGNKCVDIETSTIEVDGCALQVNDTRATVINKLGNPDRTVVRPGWESFVYEDLKTTGALNVRFVKDKVVRFSFPFHW